jgi:hypothetical protein
MAEGQYMNLQGIALANIRATLEVLDFRRDLLGLLKIAEANKGKEVQELQESIRMLTEFYENHLQYYNAWRTTQNLLLGVELYLRGIPPSNTKVCVLCYTRIICPTDNQFLKECEENAKNNSEKDKVQVLPICISCQQKYAHGKLTTESLAKYLEVQSLFSLLLFLYYINLIDRKKGHLCPYLLGKFNLNTIGSFKMKWCPKHNKKEKCKLLESGFYGKPYRICDYY